MIKNKDTLTKLCPGILFGPRKHYLKIKLIFVKYMHKLIHCSSVEKTTFQVNLLRKYYHFYPEDKVSVN